MASTHEHHRTITPLKQLPHWSQLGHRGPDVFPDLNKPPLVHHEPLRPIESGYSQTLNRTYSSDRPRENAQVSHRLQLPGVHELLSPSIRTEIESPASGNWAPINNPPVWRDRFLSTVGGSTPGFSHAVSTAPSPNHVSSYRRHTQIEMPHSEGHKQNSVNMPVDGSIERPPSLSALSLRQPAFSAPSNHGHQGHPQSSGQYFLSLHCQSTSDLSGRGTIAEQMLEQRANPEPSGLINGLGANGAFNTQIVGQRDIPGEGLCYVFKDGSTCPTVIDGEPVNPLWGTTKAGKARKRLAQACLNCREKKIKCEPGEISCLQCEKAKRECLRPSVQPHTEAATGPGSSMSNSSTEHGEWRSQASPRSTTTCDLPAPKRRRSAHVAQQESAFLEPSIRIVSPSNEFKRWKSPEPVPAQPKLDYEMQRKDSKRPFLDECDQEPDQTLSGSSGMTAQYDDPYQSEPDGTMLFLNLFFAQSAREVHMLFPRESFTRWVRTCETKCQSECMVLEAILALGSAFSKNEFSSFAKLCLDRATQAAASLYGQFSIALIQTRLLLATCSHMRGEDSLTWEYSGSALRGVSALGLNVEEGLGGVLDDSARPQFGFTREQSRECKRRTFWTAFLMDRYSTFSPGTLSTIQEDDVHVRLPSTQQSYEDGLASSAPLFDSFGFDSAAAQVPSTYTITVSVMWKEVVQFLYRSEHHPPSIYAARYEAFSNSIQRRLSDWMNRLPSHLRYTRENLERAVLDESAGDFVSMHTLYLFSHLKLARTVRHEHMAPPLVARSICTAHSHALQLLALVRDLRVVTQSSQRTRCRTTDLISSFVSDAVIWAIDTVGAGGLREETLATTQVLSTATGVIKELSQYCTNAERQSRLAEKRLAHIESCPLDHDVRTRRGVDGGRCWRIAQPMGNALSLRQDVMYGVSTTTFCEALVQGRKR